MTEQRYKAVLAVIGDGRTVGEVARDWGISRRTMHGWLARYKEEGLDGLKNRSHRPAHSPSRCRQCGRQRCWRRAEPSLTGVRVILVARDIDKKREESPGSYR